jgi:predicted MPP superfamily phosphohydrolase
LNQRVRRALRVLGWLTVLSLLGLVCLVAWGLNEASADPIQRHTRLDLPGLASDAPPYRVALLSDIHFGNRAMQRERLERIVAQVNAATPDLVVIAGDFVNGHEGRIETRPGDFIAPLAGLTATDGVIATMGNHDHWTDPGTIQLALGKAGITILSNQAIRRGPLQILGLDDDYSRHADFSAASQAAIGMGGVPVVVTHSPDLSPSLSPEVGLVLAGHTHCGQVVLPGIGSLALPFGKLVGDAHYFDVRYQCGVVRDPHRTTIVTAGLGSGSIPIRIGAPPDWWLVTLSPG